MSIKDITNYVRQTPGNTNPSVVRSMVEAQVGEYVDEAANEALRKLGISTEKVEKTIVPETEVSAVVVGNGVTVYNLEGSITDATQYIVTLNGVKHECKSYFMDMGDGSGYICLGNFFVTLLASLPSDFSPEQLEEIKASIPQEYMPDVPFFIGYYPGEMFVLQHEDGDIGTITVSIIETVETVTPIRGKYLPMDTITEAAMEKLGIREEKTRVSQVLSITKDLTFDVDEETGIGNVWIDDRGLVLEHGKTYEVVVDGKSYYCQAIDERAWYLLGVFPPSSDCPFYINSDRDTIDLFVKGTETTHTVDIYETVEKTAPISDKYLPEGKVGRSEWEVIFNHTYMFMGGAAIGDLDGDGIADGFPLVVGKRYMITFDGVDYEYTCELMPGESVSYIGSLEFLESGIADGQAPVVFMDTSSLPQPGGTYIVTADKTPTQHTIKVAVEKITPINQKYLPGVCLPVVDLETVIDLGETGLTEVLLSDSDNQKLNSAVSQGAPVPINFTFKHGGNIPCGVMITTNTMFVNGDIIALFADFRMLAMGNTLYHITIANNEGNWSANLGTVKAIEDLM